METYLHSILFNSCRLASLLKQFNRMICFVPIKTFHLTLLSHDETEAGNEAQEAAQCSKSSDVSEEVIQGEVNETASVVSAGKHSVSFEVLFPSAT